MSKKETNSLPGVLAEIETGMQAYRAAAAELTNRVERFEEWLGRLPGKVQAQVYDAEDDHAQYFFTLGLRRDGKQWKLKHWIEDASDEIIGGITDLRDGSIETKIRAIGLFPELLAAIRDAQTEFVERSAEAAAEFDKFATMIGMDASKDSRKVSKGDA